MAFLTKEQDICDAYEASKTEAEQFQVNYPEYKRLADNEVLDDDEDLPLVNDGTLAASLFNLPKRIVNSDLSGRAKADDSADAWVTELANIEWETNIVPNANSQAPFHRKWKDAVRRAAIYGHVPIVNLFVERGNYIGSDFIVAQPGDVRVESGKISDYDSDLFFWDVYYSKLQLEALIERAERETKEQKENSEQDGYSKWDIPALKEILESFQEESPDNRLDNTTDKPKRTGVHFTVVFQRGIQAPFYMYYASSKKNVREWSNPDPSGDVPVHFLYCYQDFENPYGVGICRLAGGTQNVLDEFRKYDVLATQLGFRPPVSIGGTDLTGLDLDSITYTRDAQWMTGNARVQREEIANQVYAQLPGRTSMYKTSLNQLIPTGDTSIGAVDSGDPQYSKTPAGVKFQQQSLSIGDDDFKDNLYITYEAVARSMINTHFANMQGTDLRNLSDENRDILMRSGLKFPLDEDGNPASNELEVIWDEARANFTFEIDAEQDKTKDEAKRLDGLLKIIELRMADPTFDQRLMASGKRINDGELLQSIITLTTDNDKIVEDIAPEDQQQMMGEQMMAEQGMQQQGMPPQEQPQDPMVYVQQLMQAYGVDQQTAMFMAEAEGQGYTPEEVLQTVQRKIQGEQVNG